MKTMRKVLAMLIVAITVFSTSIIAFAAAGEFTIVFNANGGSGSMSNQKVTYGTVTRVNANEFKRSGYIFRGWNVQREDGTWNTEKLRGGDEGWRKDIPDGYHKTLYKNAEKVARTAPAGAKATFYAVWEGANDKFSTFNRVGIKETNKNFDGKTNPMFKSDNQFWVINSKAAYPGFSTKSTGVYVGAIALAIIDNMLNGKYDTTFKKYHNDDKTLFSSIGYTYAPDFTNYQVFVQAIYDQIVNGYPVPIKVKEPSGHAIYAVAYGVLSNKGRPDGQIVAHDIAVIDAYSGSWRRLDEMYKYTPNGTYEMGIAVWNSSYFYNLGEETYSFDNYGDNDSLGGHCFGMSITSAGYYTNNLDVTQMGIDSCQKLYTINEAETPEVKEPICDYQNKQGSYSLHATVAGGSYYKDRISNISSDWDEVINYVKNHSYDNKGLLQIGFRKEWQGGHAINFLRYEVVNGQERIYAYDNNFPNIETYFFKDSNEKIYQAPISTFSGAIDCIALRDVNKYYSIVDDFDATRCIYVEKNTIKIEDKATEYLMDCGAEIGEYVMYEIPDGVNEVLVKPLKDNASFVYCDETYSFNSINDGTYGTLKLKNEEDEAVLKNDFQVSNEPMKVKSVSIDNIKVNYNSSANIVPKINVTDGVSYSVKYDSSDPSVATVDQDGKITALHRGKTTVTCIVTDEYGNTVKDTCTVTVKISLVQWMMIIFFFGFLWY